MFRAIRRGEVGFTLVELLVVMAILATLAGLVAGTIVGTGSRGQQAKLDGDRDTIGKAAKRFSTDAFPETFPVVNLADTDASITVSPDLGIRLIDFKRGLPQDPTKKFVPNFLNEIPDSSALVSWRIDTNSGNVFFAADGAPLIKPSNNRLDVAVVTNGVTGALAAKLDHLLTLSMSKNEAALQTLKVRVPEGYSLGGQFAPADALVGVLSASLGTDNEVDSGQTIRYGGVIVATGTANEWKLVVNYNDNVSTSGSSNVSVKLAAEAVRVHTISIFPPSLDTSGTLTLKISRGSDVDQNLATETWKLTILGEATQDLTSVLTVPSTPTAATGGLATTARTLTTAAGFAVNADAGTAISPAVAILTTPATKAVYRWLAEENTTIDPVVGTVEFFGDVPGSQGVLIK